MHSLWHLVLLSTTLLILHLAQPSSCSDSAESQPVTPVVVHATSTESDFSNSTDPQYEHIHDDVFMNSTAVCFNITEDNHLLKASGANLTMLCLNQTQERQYLKSLDNMEESAHLQKIVLRTDTSRARRQLSE